ncbi:DUF484 domain-containing protein [Marinicauda salina]|uniref:DUF484 domain-containing protein n=1 Tax=Marinicauda salina TaxID=2135793 RepID=A0A2U2BW72_9PROT|nr:DUF484 family protein [Marinicauda salina]PWE18229.1 DUF484 domain-containing protein [Marinicauda salina]
MTDTSASEPAPLRLVDPAAVADEGDPSLAIPEEDAGADAVIDLHAAARGRLEAEIGRLKATNEALVSLAKSNLAAQAQTHAAVLALFEAETLAALDRKLAGRIAETLGVETVRVFIEGHAPLKSAEAVLGAAPELVGALLGDHAERLGPVDRRFADALYGPQAARIESEALARLEIAGHEGVLCLGARERSAFQADQGADLLHFLARAVERRITPWLRS